MSELWPRGDPRDVARAIVADPRYRLDRPAHVVQKTWWDAVLEWIGGVVRGLLHGLDHVLSARSPVDAAIGLAIIAAAFVLLAYCVFVLVRSYLRGAGSRPAAAAGEGVGAATPSAEALRAAAIAAARAGRYRDAAALLFVSAVRALDERGRVSYDPARTPGEYRRLVRDPAFDALAGDAVVALFAAAEPRGELFERMSGSYDRCFGASAQ